MLAAAGAGLHPDVATAASEMSRLAGHAHEPDAACAEQLDAGYRRYRELFDALAPSFTTLA
jgi:ribulose kinase